MVSTITQALATDRVTISRQTISDPIAQTLYLQVRQRLNTGWWGFTQEAVDAIRKAHALAPGDPRIAGTLALVLIRGFANDEQPKEILREARRAIEIACEADPEQPEARVARGLLNLANNEAAAAVGELQRALAFAPNSIDALDGLGRILSDVGAIDHAEAFLQRAIAIQPTLLAVKHLMARTRVLLGDYEAADALLGDPPDDVMARFGWVLMKARFLGWRGDPQSEVVLRDFIRETQAKLPADNPFLQLITVLVDVRPEAEMKIALDQVVPMKGHITPRRAAFHAQLQAETLAVRGFFESAIEALRMADVQGFVDIFWLQRCKLFDVLRNNTEFEAIRQRTEVRAQRVIDALENG